MAVLQVTDFSVQQGGKSLLKNLSFSIQEGEQWAVIGPSGSGKTTLLLALAGRQFFSGHLTIHDSNPVVRKRLVLVEQQHHFKTLSNTSNFYYQQRFNSQDAGDAITVWEDLQKVLRREPNAHEQLEHLADLFDLKKLYNEPLIQLSNGENKRLQITKALLLQPAFLLLDNPFTGLDVQSRKTLEEVLHQVAKKGIHIILVTAAHHLPFFVTHVLSLAGDSSFTTQPVDPALWNKNHLQSAAIPFDTALLHTLTAQAPTTSFEFAVRMQNVTITYDKKILDNITWQVRNGECWSLSGPNGSGKSTLLSLVNADNPQAYANEIYLFDRRRGTGESIWDIKKQTGFVSPELHLYFERSNTAFDVVASGLFDTIGLFRKLTARQKDIVAQWMQLLHIDKLKNRYLFQLSNSEQRLVLLARALVKNPPLLVLDEPCQGLDEVQAALFRHIINEICRTTRKTLIYVSHITHEIPACVTHFIRLDKGRIQCNSAFI